MARKSKQSASNRTLGTLVVLLVVALLTLWYVVSIKA
jgi:hypothetical protein